MSEAAVINEIPEKPQASVRLTTEQIDLSCRTPLLLLFASALTWLTLGLAFLFLSSIKLHAPNFLAASAWLTLGRIRPAAMNAILYGFASQAALGVLLWMFCRLGGNRLALPSMVLTGGVIWNLGVTIGFLAILAGATTGFQFLEMPGGVALLLLLGYVMMGATAGITFRYRRERPLYVSQWYLLAALFWFPWIYSAANLLLLVWPGRGTLQSIVDAWYVNNFLGLWLGSVSLASIFYFIPKLLERPLYSWWLAVFGFWTFAFFNNWAGLNSLAGGPAPAWMISASIAASVAMLLPLLATALNWHSTIRQSSYRKFWEDMTLWFVGFGAISYLAATLMAMVLGLREVSAWTRFTYLDAAQSHLTILGFIAMPLLGSMYFVVPRLVRKAWPGKNFGPIFLLFASGIALVFLAYAIGGAVQSAKLAQAKLPFIKVVRATVPFVGIGTLGYMLMLAGQILFVSKLFVLLWQQIKPTCKSVYAFIRSQSQPEETA
jgi:cytochrome c oxidase cbb3-type subunit I